MESPTSSKSMLRISSTYSQFVSAMTGTALKAIKGVVEDNYFKGFAVNTGTKQAREARSGEKDYFRAKPPYLMLNIGGKTSDSLWLTKPRALDSPAIFFREWRRFYPCIISDNAAGIRLYAVPDRRRIQFDARIRVETFMQANDLGYIYEQAFKENRPYCIRRQKIPFIIPNRFIAVAAAALGIDLEAPGGLEAIESWLKEHSPMNPRRVLRGANNSSCFFFNYTQDPIFQLTGAAEYDNPGRNGLAFENATVALSFFVETAVPALFLMEADHFPSMDSVAIPEVLDDGVRVNLVWSIPLSPPRSTGNKSLICTVEVMTEGGGEQIVELSPALPQTVLRVIDINKEQGVPNSEFFEISVFGGDIPVPKGGFEMDWDKDELLLKEPFSNFPYTIAVYAHLGEFSRLAGLS